MSGPITRRLKPEEEELLRKREELASIRAASQSVSWSLSIFAADLPPLRVAT